MRILFMGTPDIAADCLKALYEAGHDICGVYTRRGIQGKIAMNLSANLLGLGNAATPLGLAAMEAMAARNPSKEAPTRGMILFVVVNTASLQLIPLNMAAMRASCGSTAPFSILPAVWVTSAASLVVCVAACKLLERDPLWNR